ncbi:unnamed protein product [Closterium sp. Yama58-4]|nr:unnamed protein product [Closterium sp. Yama58-4]
MILSPSCHSRFFLINPHHLPFIICWSGPHCYDLLHISRSSSIHQFLSVRPVPSRPPQARLLSQAAVHVQHLKDACRALTATGHAHITVPSPSASNSGPTSSAQEGAWAVEGVSFCGRVEEAKLLALEGQEDMAVLLLRHLLRQDLPLDASQGSPSPAASAATSATCVPVLDCVYTLGLAAKWLGETRSIRFGRIGRLDMSINFKEEAMQNGTASFYPQVKVTCMAFLCRRCAL